MHGHRIPRLLVGAVTLVLFIDLLPKVGPVQAGMILVSSQPAKSSVLVNESFTVEITADITENILGFGLDLLFDPALLVVSDFTIVAPFLPLRSPDGDHLAGLAYPRDVTGRDVALVTVTFLPLAAGKAEIAVGFTEDDPAEGFPEYGVGRWSELTTVPAVVTIESSNAGGAGPGPPGPPEPEPTIPEPATLLLCATTAVGLGRYRRA
jgi:hypothetical protein